MYANSQYITQGVPAAVARHAITLIFVYTCTVEGDVIDTVTHA